MHQWLTRVRLDHAVALVPDGVKIEAVALLVGYHSKKNFYRQFRRRFGTTPFAHGAAARDQVPTSEGMLIEEALAVTERRVSGGSGPAERLGVPVSTLEAKIRRFGINKYRYRAPGARRVANRSAFVCYGFAGKMAITIVSAAISPFSIAPVGIVGVRPSPALV